MERLLLIQGLVLPERETGRDDEFVCSEVGGRRSKLGEGSWSWSVLLQGQRSFFFFAGVESR